MIANNMLNYPPMNNLFLLNQMNQNFYNSYNNQYIISKTNNSYIYRPNYYISNCPNFAQKNILFKKQNNNNIYSNKKQIFNIKSKQYKENIPIKKEENIYERINNIKMSYRKKNSVNTIISDSSFNSSTSDEEDKVNEGEEINQISEIKKKERRLSNMSEGLSLSSDFTSHNSSFSYSEKEKEKNFNSQTIVNKKIINDNKSNNKTEEYQGNPQFENTEILKVNVKISKEKYAVFKLKRYDDLFETIKIFCEINSIDEKLIKPLIIKSLSTLNTIYQVVNSKLDQQQIELLKKIKNK